MSEVSIDDRGTDLKELVSRVKQGDEIVILEGAVPVARITKAFGQTFEPRERQFGTLRASLLYMADDFDAPLEDFADYM